MDSSSLLQVIKLQIDLLGLDIEKLKYDEKIEVMEEIDRIIVRLKTGFRFAPQSHGTIETNDSVSQFQLEHEKGTVENLNEATATLHQQHKCKFCGRYFEKLLNHGSSCRKSPEYISSRIFACNECDYRSKTMSLMEKHQVIHAGTHQCKQCQFTAYSDNDLRIHLRNPNNCGKHLLKFEKIMCKECDYFALSKKELNYHSKEHSLKKYLKKQVITL